MGKAMVNPSSLVSAAELKDLMGKDNVVVVDYSDKPEKFIPGAVWIPRSELVYEFEGDLMNTQSLEVHEKVLGEKGIDENTTIVIYDSDDFNYCFNTRLQWQLRAYGHKDARVLNGGLKAWIEAGGEVVDKPAEPKAGVTYKGRDNTAAVRADLKAVLAATNNPDYVLLDIRTQEEWDGGRVPGAMQLHYPQDLLNEDFTFKTVEEYEELLKDVPKDKKVIVYCLGGIRSSGLMYVMTDFLGWPTEVRNYDGSWWNYSWSGSPVEK